jgi:hypothetical protein
MSTNQFTLPVPATVRAALLIFAFSCATRPATAQFTRATDSTAVPNAISFQGVLTDTSGTPISGTETVIFSIYRDQILPTSSWSETQSVDFSEGLFQVYLGDVNTLPDTIFNGQTLYLGIKVGTDEEMTPRQRLATTPYSFLSSQAACTPATWYADVDGDLYGDALSDSTACTMPLDFAANNLDCDDGEVNANPGETEVCDTIDNDCDDEIDEGLTTAFCTDFDGDGYGSNSDQVLACEPPVDTAECGLDCEDDVGSINPGATELCDTLDNDCDGATDDADSDIAGLPIGVTGASIYYLDADLDSYGDESGTQAAFCNDPGFGWSTNNEDCADDNENINPGQTEICNNGFDDNCDNLVDLEDPGCSL